MTIYLAPSASMPTIWRYVIRGPHHSWAVIVIDSHGFVFVNSDFGGYAHRWTHFGPCIRTFLTEIQGDYVLGKLTLGWPTEYCAEKTERAVKNLILSERRSGGLTKPYARREWDLLKYHEDLGSEMAFGKWLDDTELHKSHCPLYELADFEPNRDAQRFVDTLFPLLQATLREALAAEAVAQVST